MHSQSYQAIVLRSHDVGDADRFLILLTKERGLLSARARSVRKLTSRMGGHLLAPNRVTVSITELGNGLLVTAAERTDGAAILSVSQFGRAMQGIELLLSLLHEDEPVEELFTATEHFLHYCTKTERNPVLPFILQALHLLGLLPDATENDAFGPLAKEEIQFIEHCKLGTWEKAPVIDEKTKNRLLRTALTIAEGQSSRALKAQATMM